MGVPPPAVMENQPNPSPINPPLPLSPKSTVKTKQFIFFPTYSPEASFLPSLMIFIHSRHRKLPAIHDFLLFWKKFKRF